MKPKTLYLTLTRKWFNMIASGKKTQEYRELKKYWRVRLCENESGYTPETLKAKEFAQIEFKNGYGIAAPALTIEFKGLLIGEGNPSWGAPEKQKVFIILLGREISRKNFKNQAQ